MTQSEFIQLACKGFGLGFALGFLLWALSYAMRTFRRSLTSGMRVLDV